MWFGLLAVICGLVLIGPWFLVLVVLLPVMGTAAFRIHDHILAEYQDWKDRHERP
jgi:hypothetical protein